jgi:hypothetical protein
MVQIGRLTLLALSIALALVSLLIGTQLSYYLGYVRSPTTTANNSVISLNFYPVLVQVTWNTSTISQYNQWVRVNETISNLGNGNVTVPSGNAASAQLYAPNGTLIFIPEYTGSSRTHFTVSLNQTQRVSIIYDVFFGTQYISIACGGNCVEDTYGTYSAHINAEAVGYGSGVYSLEISIAYPTVNQTQVISVPIKADF